MYLNTGIRFTSLEDVRQKIRLVQKRWDTVVVPAIVQVAVESGRHCPESDELNGKLFSSIFSPL